MNQVRPENPCPPIRPVRDQHATPVAVTLGLLILTLALTGCGQKTTRLIRLATFEMPADEAEGPIFMAMVQAYYRANTNDSAHHQRTAPQASTVHNYPPRFLTNHSTTSEESEALEALLRIQSVDQSTPLTLPAITDSWQPTDWWDHLSIRSRRAFATQYPISEPAK